jgi:hypothetical protein
MAENGGKANGVSNALVIEEVLIRVVDPMRTSGQTKISFYLTWCQPVGKSMVMRVIEPVSSLTRIV